MTDREALEHFVVHNQQLEGLERRIARFNIFDALGVVHQELRHSDLLAFLLDPSQKHGLDDRFLKMFLKTALANANLPPELSPIDIEVANMSAAEVRREWRRIDLLIKDEWNKTVIAIENKVRAGEGPGQLHRYRQVIESDPEFTGYRRAFLFLTPDLQEGEDEAWLSCSYDQVANCVDRLIESHSSTIGTDVHTTLTHYLEMLRRYIVEDSEIPELCRAIYKEHREALNLIFEHKPDLQREIAEHLQELVRSRSDLILDVSGKTYVRFAPIEWDKFDAQKTGSGWTRTGRVVLFEFDNRPNKLALAAIVGPAEPALREHLHSGILSSGLDLKSPSKKRNEKWASVHVVKWLNKRDLEKDISELKPRLDELWEKALANELPMITRVVTELLKSHEDRAK